MRIPKKRYSFFNCGVYFLFDDDELIYIGSSINVHLRVAQHTKTFTSYSFIKMPIKKARKLEKMYIKHYKPKYNVQRYKFWKHSEQKRQKILNLAEEIKLSNESESSLIELGHSESKIKKIKERKKLFLNFLEFEANKKKREE